MKIAIIGSTQYEAKMGHHVFAMEREGHEVRVPAFDHDPGLDDLDEFGICDYNREMIEWADRVDIFWDQRSMGTVFDFGMAFALRKPIKIVYLEPKTLAGVMRKYEAQNDAG